MDGKAYIMLHMRNQYNRSLRLEARVDDERLRIEITKTMRVGEHTVRYRPISKESLVLQTTEAMWTLRNMH